jgi:2-iminobutanoate/2-iminopropanoate deaminase
MKKHILSTFLLFSLIIVSACNETTPSPEPVQQQSVEVKEVIDSPDAPKAIGPYSQAIKIGNTVWLAGQIALEPTTGGMVTGSIQIETTQVMSNIQAVLTAAGMSLKDVVQVQVFLSDLNDYQAFNELYAEYFPENPPARAVVQAARLPRDAKVEIMMIAYKAD